MDGINETLNIQTSMFNHKLEAVLKTVLKTVLLKTNFLGKNHFNIINSESIERELKKYNPWKGNTKTISIFNKRAGVLKTVLVRTNCLG